VQVAPSSGTLTRIGGTLALEATTFDERGTVVLGRQVSWRSLNPHVVSVDEATGAVTAVGSGQAVVEAMTTLGLVLRGYALVTVAAPAAEPVGVLVGDTTAVRAQLNALWGVSPDTVFAAGRSGELRMRGPGERWEELDANTQLTLFGVLGTQGDTLILVGDSGLVLRYWPGRGVFRDSTTTTATLRGVWAASPTDIYAVGSAGTILRFAGQAIRGYLGVTYRYIWDADSSGTVHGLRAVWGSGADDIYAVGDAGTIRHFDGTAWRGSSSGTAAVLTGVWGTGRDDVYVAAADGVVLRGSWRGWRAALRDSTASFTSVWGISSDEVYVGSADGRVLRWDGERWAWLPGAGGGAVRALWGTAASPLLAVGDGGLSLTARRGGAARLVFSELPMADVSANLPFELAVAVVSDAGRVDTAWADSITLSLAEEVPGAALLGTTTRWAERGVARFPGLRLTAAGSGFVLVATAAGLAPAQSPPLAVVGGQPQSLTFIGQPGNITAGGTFSPAVVVGALDENGGQVGLSDTVLVRVRLLESTPGALLLGDTVVRVTNGVATFADLSETKVGNYRLLPSAGGLAGEPSVTFTVGPGPAVGVAIRLGPYGAILPGSITIRSWSSVTFTAASEDAFGNLVDQYVPARWVYRDHSGILGTGVISAAYRISFEVLRSGQVGLQAVALPQTDPLPDITDELVVTVATPWPSPVQSWAPAALSGGSFDYWGVEADADSLGSQHLGTVTGSFARIRFPNQDPYDLSQNGVAPSSVISGLAGTTGATGAPTTGYRLTYVSGALAGATAHQTVGTVVLTPTAASPVVVFPPSTLEEADTDSSRRYAPRGWGVFPLSSQLTVGLHSLWRCSTETGACEPEFTAPGDVFLHGVHAFALNNFFVVGDGGRAWHKRGSTLTSIPVPTTEALLGVWGTAEDDVFAVGTGGVICHWDGTAWQAQSSGTTRTLWDVWGASSSDVYAVGDGGTILRYDGTAWTAMNSGTTADLHAVDGSAGPHVFVVGSGGTVLVGSR